MLRKTPDYFSLFKLIHGNKLIHKNHDINLTKSSNDGNIFTYLSNKKQNCLYVWPIKKYRITGSWVYSNGSRRVEMFA